MSGLSNDALALIRAARGAGEPSAAAVARVRDAIHSRIAAGDVIDASKAPPPNTAAAIARGALMKWAGAVMIAVCFGASPPGRGSGSGGAATRAERVAATTTFTTTATATTTTASAQETSVRPEQATARNEGGGVEGRGSRTPVACAERVASRGHTVHAEQSAARNRRVGPEPVSVTTAPARGEQAATLSVRGDAEGRSAAVFAQQPQLEPLRVSYLTVNPSEDSRAAQRTPPHADANIVAPSDAMANALRLYAQDRWAEAATQFQRVVEGGTPDDPATVQRAQFHLARALEHLGLHQAALDVFDEVVQRGPEHPYFAPTLPWLAALSRELPEPAGIARRVGAYDQRYLGAFDHDDTRDLHDELLYLRGRAYYDEAQLEPAVALFRRIRPGSRYYARARFFQGVASVRAHRAQPAVDAFREVLGAIEHGVANIEERERMSDLAWLELARLYYATGHYASAIDAWDRIHVESEYWLDAEFEEAWAYMLTQDYPRALGNIHTLNGPYFERAWYPESLVLRGVIQFTNCQYDDAETAVAEFHARYGSRRESLEHYLDAHDGSERAAELVRDARDAEHRMPRALVPLATAAVGDRTVRRYLEYVERIDAEQAMLQSLPRELRDSSLGARILAGDAVARSFALDGAADLVRQRYRRAADELRDLQNQATAISIEILDARRGELALESQGTHVPAAGAHQPQIVAVDQWEDGLLWPFDGEYWRDEQGTYRQRIQPRCTR